MKPRTLGIERDYNRGLPRPVRAARSALAAGWSFIEPVTRWILEPKRRDWAVPLSIGLGVTVLLLPLDGAISAGLRRMEIEGDLGRELSAWQQFGALGSLLFVAAAVWLLDPPRRRRLLDLVAATSVAWVAVGVLKLATGRPRPRDIYNDPSTFLGPWGQYPVEVEPGTLVLMHSWDPAGAASADLWSMPSSHTAAAAALAVFLIALYPRIRPLAVVLVAIVGVCRMLFGAHWPTDVFMGAAVGVAAGQVAVGRYWGVRTLDWLWVKMVNPRVVTALGRTLSVEQDRGGLGAGPHGPSGGGSWHWWHQKLADWEASGGAGRRGQDGARNGDPAARGGCAQRASGRVAGIGSGHPGPGTGLGTAPERDRRPEGV